MKFKFLKENGKQVTTEFPSLNTYIRVCNNFMAFTSFVFSDTCC